MEVNTYSSCVWPGDRENRRL